MRKSLLSVAIACVYLSACASDSAVRQGNVEPPTNMNAPGTAAAPPATPAGPPASSQQLAMPKTMVLSKLQSAGLEFKMIAETRVDPEQEAKFPEKPTEIFSIRLSDGKGNSSPMTLVGFSSDSAATQFKNRKVNGFAVRNWFFMGTINNYFKEKIETAFSR